MEVIELITMKNIIREGNPTLRARAKALTFPLTAEQKELGHALMEFLENSQDPDIAKKYQLRAGVGLAAPQVDQSIRMTAVLVPDENDQPLFKHILVNPTIISESVKMAALAEGEGCLSVDRDVPGYVPRHQHITLRWYDLEGTKHIDKLRNYPAIVCQHEIDHLNGVLFFDHINMQKPFVTDDNTVLIG
ncbi:peptide deformylase [Liquorilactobacillus ghanensis DSM 18630]|uniref:Peptide deformylase n=1 Tax=Liquorilactobacillus ghanensis DSM 18630 TaxID=1423750 RepID=A0A0R1VXC1_9LACO|nr:peptide deformylase [Liquorilactobacillus ghanensis DSM 18630]